MIGNEGCPVSDTWWQTETGGFMISPAPGIELAPLKPGSATLPMPGVDPLIVDEDGKAVGTAEIEYALVSYRAVAESSVVGKKDERKGEVPICFVVLKNGRNPSPELQRELIRHFRDTIGPVATPQELHFVSSLPKTRSGKIMRRVVKAIVEGENVGDVTTLEDKGAIEALFRLWKETSLIS